MGVEEVYPIQGLTNAETFIDFRPIPPMEDKEEQKEESPLVSSVPESAQDSQEESTKNLKLTVEKNSQQLPRVPSASAEKVKRSIE